MKRYGYLFEKIIDIDNIRLAHKNARKGKTHYDEVREIDENECMYMKKLQDMLISGEFTTSEYEIYTKNDRGKERTIYKLPYFPDRIVHHTIMQVLEPIWKKSMIANTFQSIKGRGPHKAIKKLKKDLLYTEGMYYVKIDINKFYPSINNNKLKEVVRQKIKCGKTLELLDDIIDSCEGVPIGNYISQYFGNIYLSKLDHQVSRIKGVKYYRYCDDIVCVSKNKELLWYSTSIIKKYVSEYKLAIKDPILHTVSKVSGLDYLGYVIYTNRVLLRRKLRDRAMSKINRNNSPSYIGWLKHCDCNNLQIKLKERIDNENNRNT